MRAAMPKYPRNKLAWKATEDANLHYLWSAFNLHPTKISDLLGRSVSAVRKRVASLQYKRPPYEAVLTQPERLPQNAPPSDVVVDLSSNVIMRRNQAVRLGAIESEVMSILLEPSTRPLCTEYIAEKLWGMQAGPVMERKAIYQYVSILRRLIKPLRLEIRSIRHHGYVVKDLDS